MKITIPPEKFEAVAQHIKKIQEINNTTQENMGLVVYSSDRKISRFVKVVWGES